jgi:predicted Fe-S protein YdhL (DUF1289 family)
MVPRVPPIHIMASTVIAIESPCTQICVVHPVRKLCIGCGRTLDEIARWIDFDTAERARIMAQLPARLRTLPAGAGTPAKA